MPPPTTQAAPSTPSTSQGKRRKNTSPANNKQKKNNKVLSNLQTDTASGGVWLAGSSNSARPIDADDGIFLVRSGTSEGEDVLLGGEHWPDGDISSSSNSNFWPPNSILGSSVDESSAAASGLSLPSYAIYSIPTFLGVLVVVLFSQVYGRPFVYKGARQTSARDQESLLKFWTFETVDSSAVVQDINEIGAFEGIDDLERKKTCRRMLEPSGLGSKEKSVD